MSALMLALLIVCSQLTIPLPIVPITLQTFAVGMVATILSPAYSALVIVAYIILGAVGLPVFAGFSGGAAVLVGPTGGYIWAFLIYGVLTSYLLKLIHKGAVNVFIANFVGAITQLLLGTIWLQIFMHVSLPKALTIGFVPFLIPLVLKVLVIIAVFMGLKRAKLVAD
jgi:biotin transport system substrate-specific component